MTWRSFKVKTVPDDLYEAVRRRAAEEGTTVSDLVVRMLRREVALPSLRHWVADVQVDAPAPPPEVDIERLMDDVRAEGEAAGR